MTTMVRSLSSSVSGAILALFAASTPALAAAPDLKAFLGYPFQSELVAAPRGGVIAWVQTIRGVRNIWAARAPGFVPRQITRNTADDGQEISQLTFSPDGERLVWVRGGDHDANSAAEGGLAPNPASNTEQPVVTIWTAELAGGLATKVTEGDAPALSSKGALAFVKDHQIWIAAPDGKGLEGKAKAERLFFDRGHDGGPVWSPDGVRLAFVSSRGDHAFIGVYAGRDKPILYLAPSTGVDESPCWSPDSHDVAYTRQPGDGGAPRPMIEEQPAPWSIWVADAETGEGRAVWRSGRSLADSYPEVGGGANLIWVADRLVFLSEADNWQHLYSVAAAGGAPLLLTPGSFMVEDVAASPDGRTVVYSANTGPDPLDSERRHLFRTPVDRAASTPLTGGADLQWRPAVIDKGIVAFIGAGVRAPPMVEVQAASGEDHVLQAGPPSDFPVAALVVPKPVTFTAADGLKIHGVLFDAQASGAASARKPAVVFVHGGASRQMMLGWHNMDYYSHAYALNQYLAAQGYVVLSVNYRRGIGYGRAFNHAPHSGPRGGAEYQDVLAGGRFLQAQPDVDPGRIGIWGGSYGGYLTAMALSHNSDVFKVGVDLHGVHDWSATLGRELPPPPAGFEKGDRDAVMALAFRSSPVADLSHWTSPVLLIQGDDDRNVGFHETVDLARRLDDLGIRYEELVLPNEIHGFLRYQSWLTADQATVRFLGRTLQETK
jgi:dipeptidyl aminopeptidase/acylaminoacyl peptidase